jgi:hypothetical protein
MVSRACGTAARSFGNLPVRTPAALAESADKNVRRVTSLCIGFPFLLHNSSFFLRSIHRLKHQLHQQKSRPKMFSVSSQVKYVAAINSQVSPVAPLKTGPCFGDNSERVFEFVEHFFGLELVVRSCRLENYALLNRRSIFEDFRGFLSKLER